MVRVSSSYAVGEPMSIEPDLEGPGRSRAKLVLFACACDGARRACENWWPKTLNPKVLNPKLTLQP